MAAMGKSETDFAVSMSVSDCLWYPGGAVGREMASTGMPGEVGCPTAAGTNIPPCSLDAEPAGGKMLPEGAPFNNWG